MIENYEVRVRRPWVGVKRGQVIKVNNRRRQQLIKMGMVVAVEPEAPAQKVAPVKKRATKPAAKG